MPQSFGERLRKAREDKGLSQSELANKAGFQPSAIAHFESDRRSPSFDNLRRLADSLAVTIDFLHGRETVPQPAGPIADQLFRDFARMTDKDQKTVADIAKMLAEKARQAKKGSDE